MILLAIALFADAAAPAATAAVTPPVQTAKPKLVCRSYAVTGSLVKKQKVCRSAGAWGKVEQDMQDEANRMNPHTTSQKGS